MGQWEEKQGKDIRRIKIYGGWLVARISCDSVVYVPDSLHTWNWNTEL